MGKAVLLASRRQEVMVALLVGRQAALNGDEANVDLLLQVVQEQLADLRALARSGEPRDSNIP